MKKDWIRTLLSDAIARRSPVAIMRKKIGALPLLCIPLQLSEKLVLVAPYTDFKPDGFEVVRLRDYLDGSIHVAGLGVVGKTPFWGSNVLYFELKDGSSFIIRPSGTEPKIKVYLLIRGGSKAECEECIEKYLHYVEVLKR